MVIRLYEGQNMNCDSMQFDLRSVEHVLDRIKAAFSVKSLSSDNKSQPNAPRFYAANCQLMDVIKQ